MAQTIIGIKCNDFVIVAASGTAAYYYIKMDDKVDTIAKLSDSKLLAVSGEVADRTNFVDYIGANLRLNKLRAHDRESTTPATAHFIRDTLAKALRKAPYQVSSILAGFDKPASVHDDAKEEPHLFFLDYLGTLQPMPFTAHGYGATFCLSILDSQWRADMTAVEAVQLMQDCINEVKKRIAMSNEFFFVKVITKEGIQVLDHVH
jgi:20S proteasome alpha/beta subunit